MSTRTCDGEIERLQGENEALLNQVRALENRVAEYEARIASLNRDIDDYRAVRRQTERQLKTRMRGLLQDGLLPLLRDIHDAASMEPVRVHIIQDRADSAVNLLNQEIAPE